MVFTAAPHADVLKLLVEISVLLLTARAFGEIAQRLRQPSVVGELAAGIALGPSFLSALFPGVGAALLPQSTDQGRLLEAVSLIGAIFLLLITGLEADAALIRRHARTAAGVAAGGLVLPLAGGFVLGELLPERLLPPGADRFVFSSFVATALSISAIPVIAKILIDLDLMRRDLGQTIVAAAIVDDTTGWILLSVVASLARGETVSTASVLRAVVTVLLFMGVSFTAGRLVVRRAVAAVRNAGGDDRMLTCVVGFTFLWATLTHLLHLEPVLGAFVMGAIFAQLRIPDRVREQLKSVALAIFAPIFFAVVGLKVNARALLEPDLAAIAVLVVAAATACKVGGAYVGARAIGGRDHWTALAYGAGLNARGAMGIIVATVGLSLGILTPEMFSIIVVMAMATSLMAPAALRWALNRQEPGSVVARRAFS